MTSLYNEDGVNEKLLGPNPATSHLRPFGERGLRDSIEYERQRKRQQASHAAPLPDVFETNYVYLDEERERELTLRIGYSVLPAEPADRTERGKSRGTPVVPAELSIVYVLCDRLAVDFGDQGRAVFDHDNLSNDEQARLGDWFESQLQACGDLRSEVEQELMKQEGSRW